MADEPGNLTIRLLQEIRREQEAFRADVQERFKDLTNRVDGNTLLLNMLAGGVHDHERRINELEQSKP